MNGTLFRLTKTEVWEDMLMKSRRIFWSLAALVLGLVPAAAQPDSKVFYAWAPKPVPLTRWKAPNKQADLAVERDHGGP